MENVLYIPQIPDLPFRLVAGVKSAVKTMGLTRKIQSDLANGMSIENVIASYLPAQEKEKIYTDAHELESAVTEYYKSMSDQVDDAWVVKMLNDGMLDLNGVERIKYLKNLIEMLADEDLENNKRVVIDSIDENASDEDVAFLLDITRTAIASHSDILCRASSQAMGTSLHKIDKETIHQLTNVGIAHAKAYAVACYLLYQCGESPWIPGETFSDELDPYTIGTASAASVEASKIMALYYQGKVAADKVKVKMDSLFRRAITFACRHTGSAIAKGMQVVIAIKAAKVSLRFLLAALHFSPWVAIVGSAILGFLFATKLITTQDLVDLMNNVWNGIKVAWNAAKHLLGPLFGTANAVIADLEVDTKEKASEETNEDEEIDEEDNEDLTL